MPARHIISTLVFAMSISAGDRLARADLVLESRFDPSQGILVGIAFDGTDDSLWIYGSSGSQLRNDSRTGTFLRGIQRPGESANDFDLTFAPEPLTLGSTLIHAGTLLAINGESGTADIHAVDKSNGVVITSLATAFGASHVVGGTYHSGRDTFFVIQDRVPSNAALRNLIAEIDPTTGNVLNTFGTSSADFTINYGDLEIDGSTGNLLLVSSDENRIRELTPTGVFVRDLVLPSAVVSPSGLTLDAGRGEIWLSSSDGTVSRLSGFAPGVVPEPSALILLAAGVTAIAGRRLTRRKLRSRV